MLPDAFLLVSFGGPEGPDDVMPFLENVVRGKNVPRERLLEVARHYELFDGVSPINEQNRALLAAVAEEFNSNGVPLPIYWGNRNWHPLLADTVEEMAADGVQRALTLVTSPFGSYPSCRQYLEDIERARQAVGPTAPAIDKLRLFYNHPGFIEPMRERVSAAFQTIPSERRSAARLLFTAHSIPLSMAERSPYERQLREACRRVVEEGLGIKDWGLDFQVSSVQSPAPSSNPQSLIPNPYSIAFQSRSGPPSQRWLEPTMADAIRRLHAEGATDIIVVPLGFLAENMEVIYDLDVEIAGLCDELGVNMIRADVVGRHPRFVQMIRELVVERLEPSSPKLFLGDAGPWPDDCAADCCRLE
jgi:ferrochelatase